MDEYKEYISGRLQELELSDLEKILEDSSISNLPNAREIIENLIEGRPLFDFNIIIENLIDLFLLEIKSSMMLGFEIVTVCIIIGLLKNISSSFGDNAVSNIAIMISSCVVISLCLSNFKATYTLCTDTINTMTYIMQILLPVVIPLLMSIGGLSSGSILSPLIMGIITLFNTLMAKVVLPMLFFSSIFILINSMTEKDYVNKLAIFLRSSATFCTGLSVTLFSGATVIQGITTKSADGVLINTAKYSLNNFIPIVGSFAADSVDMIISCIGIIKNAVSIFGVIVIISVLAIPILKLLAIAVIYKVSGILAEPIGIDNISDCLNEMGNSVITMCVVLFLTALMFLIFITVIIGIGGANL